MIKEDMTIEEFLETIPENSKLLSIKEIEPGKVQVTIELPDKIKTQSTEIGFIKGEYKRYDNI